MANTLTAIMPTIYAGLAEASRELIGFAPAVQRDAKFEQAAVGQTVTVPVVPKATTGNVTPGATPPNDGDQTLGNINVTITNSKYSPVRWNGEEQLALGPTGQYNAILARQFAESFRALGNLIEADLGTTLYKNASRAYGTAGTAPFATAGDLTDFAGVNQILDANGAPQTGRRLVVGSAARFNLEGKQSVLFKVNEAGTDALLRARQLPQVENLTIGYSAGIQAVAAGTAAGYLVNNGAGYLVGDTSIVIDTGTGTIPQGTYVTFAGDANKYVAAADATTVLLTLQKPGLLIAAADNTAITKGSAFTANIGFHELAAVLAARAPARPAGGDSADDVTMVADPVSGLAFEVALYRQYRQVKYEVSIAWGSAVVKPEHVMILLG